MPSTCFKVSYLYLGTLIGRTSEFLKKDVAPRMIPFKKASVQNRCSGRKSWPTDQLQINFKYHTHTFNLERKQQVPFGVDVASELAHSDPLHLLGLG